MQLGIRYRSYQLADELRQSGDDLTRMIRTYVATGDPVYKEHFQDILDIRDGKKPRPENYSRPYWDLVLAKVPAPRGNQPAVPLLELMRKAGFTDQEFGKLAEAKANSDALTLPELEAIKLVETAGPEAEANRARAVRMLYDDQYHQAKVAVMRPIHDFFVLLDRRTLAEVQKAESSSLIYQYLFGLFGLGLMFMLWRTYVALGDTLGGGVDEVYAHIARIGRGDLSSAITVKSSPKNSVLGWLAETQARLSDVDRERNQAAEALRASEENYQLLFREMQNGFAHSEIICDAQGRPINSRYLAINPAFERITGRLAEAVVGKTILEVFPALEPGWLETFGRVALTGEPAYFEMRVAELGITLDVSAFCPAPNQYACTFSDITERKQAEEEKVKLETQLRQSQKLESIGQLAGGVAHDFNNMLSVINGYSEMILAGLSPSDPNYSRIQEINKAGNRSAELTRQLLAFARRQPIAPKVLDLNDTVAGMLNMLQRLIGENIELLWKPAANPWKVKMDPSQINQILANLLVNSRDSISGNGKIIIEAGKADMDEAFCKEHPDSVPGKYLVLSVSDTGSGMSKETLGHVFEPFFTTKKVGEGTGLGLATVFGIVKQNNGFINVYSEPGNGTTFKIYLPRTEAPETEERPKAVEILTGTETVLLVEDEESLLRIAKIQLDSLGYNVLAADSPEKAISIAGEYKGEIHLLMTDVVMPEMSGRVLRDSLTATRPGIKCLFMSGYTADIISSNGVLDKGIHFLEKPFTAEDLSGKLRKALA